MSFLDHFAGSILQMKAALRRHGMADTIRIELADHDQGMRLWCELQSSPGAHQLLQEPVAPHLVTDLSGRNWQTVSVAGVTIRWPAKHPLARTWSGAPPRKWGRSS